MPELPEVETVRRGLAPVMEGQTITHAQVNRPDLRWPLPTGLAQTLRGARVLRLGRRSKYILADLDCDETLIVHLGMSGRMLITWPDAAPANPPYGTLADRPAVGQHLASMDQGAHAPLVPGAFALPQGAAGKHDHIVLDMSGGARITFNDPRRFGMMDLAPTNALTDHPMLSGLGPEPLGNAFDAPMLIAAFAGRRTPVKSALLDQKIVAGLGNIYVCEALHRAGIDPRRHAGRISAARIHALVPIIRDVLSEAIAAGGSSLRDYRQADGELGYFQHDFKAYGREDHLCKSPGCGGTIARIVQSGRSTFYCPACQR